LKPRVESVRPAGVKIITPHVFEDDRGFFMEVFRADMATESEFPTSFVQENHSRSIQGVLRGLHFQWDPPMGKLMRVTVGSAYLVAVDIRRGSPTLGQWHGIEATAENKKQVWAPAGFARGFCVNSDSAEIQYLTTGVYNSESESGILWNDPRLGIEWPVADPTLSSRDQSAQTLDEWLERPESNSFRYQGPDR
jgi:dTDP-4-dehydrorhamnose 3,5-epimerase